MRSKKQSGAAILGAMVTVTMVATIAGAAVLHVWKSAEVESAERDRVQSQWLLRAALDWSRLLLRQDAQTSNQTDHLSEPWAVPLQETKLSTFVQAQAGVGDASTDTEGAFLAGRIQDNQAKLNLKNMVLDTTGKHALHVKRLFDHLGIQQGEFDKLEQGFALAAQATASSPLMPQTLADLQWLGLSQKTIALLEPHAILLDRLTSVNANTASPAAIWAVSEDLDFTHAQAIVDARKSKHFSSTTDITAVVSGKQVGTSYLSVRSNNFGAQGFLRMGDLAIQMQADLSRTNLNVGIQGASASALVPQ